MLKFVPSKKDVSAKPGLPDSSDDPTGLKMTVETYRRLTIVSDRIRK